MANRDSYFMLDIVDDNDDPALHVTTPSSVLVIGTPEQLQERLDAFSDPIKNKVVQNTVKARRCEQDCHCALGMLRRFAVCRLCG